MTDGDWENRNARYDAAKNILYFKRCPRTFIQGHDMACKHPRRDCPLRGFNDRGDGFHSCGGPTSINYAWDRVSKEQRFLTTRMCCLKGEMGERDD